MYAKLYTCLSLSPSPKFHHVLITAFLISFQAHHYRTPVQVGSCQRILDLQYSPKAPFSCRELATLSLSCAYVYRDEANDLYVHAMPHAQHSNFRTWYFGLCGTRIDHHLDRDSSLLEYRLKLLQQSMRRQIILNNTSVKISLRGTQVRQRWYNDKHPATHTCPPSKYSFLDF